MNRENDNPILDDAEKRMLRRVLAAAHGLQDYHEAGWRAARRTRLQLEAWRFLAILFAIGYAVLLVMFIALGTSQGGAAAARRGHIPEVAGSSPAPAIDANMSPAESGEAVPKGRPAAAFSQHEPVEPAEQKAWRIVHLAESSAGADLRAGDGGAASGHAQHHEARWNEVCARIGVDWPWPEATYDADKARVVTIAAWYIERAGAVAAGDVETLVRCHRRPNDPYGGDNDEYWRDAIEKYERLRDE